MKLSFSQCSLLSSVKNGDLSQVTQLIEELSKCVSNFISMHSKLDCQFRQQLYTFTFSYIIQSLQGQNIHIPINEQDCPQNVIIEIIQGIKQFKTDLFDLAAQNPNLPLFDFLVSQQFNDLYDVLTASERQLNQQLEPLTPTKKQNILSTKPSYYYNDQIKIRSSSVGHICSNKQLQQNELELDFSLLKQFVYDQIEQKQIIEQSPKAKNKINPQLFSFDSTFVKDLPLSRFNATSNYDDNQFNFTLQKDALEDAVQTSRFESQRIDEEEFFTTDQSSSDIEFNLDRSYREWDARFRLLAEKEKQVAQRELKTIIQEKHLLNRTRSQMLVSPNKENSTTSINSYDLYCQQLNATYNNKEQTFKKKMGHLKGKMYSLVEEMKINK